MSLNLPALQDTRSRGGQVGGDCRGLRSSIQRGCRRPGWTRLCIGSGGAELADLAMPYTQPSEEGVRRNLRYFPDDPIVDASILDPEVSSLAGCGAVFLASPVSGFRNLDKRFDSMVHAPKPVPRRAEGMWTIGHNGKHAVGVWVGGLSGIGDQSFVGSVQRAYWRRFSIWRIRRTDAPPPRHAWTLMIPFRFPKRAFCPFSVLKAVAYTGR